MSEPGFPKPLTGTDGRTDPRGRAFRAWPQAARWSAYAVVALVLLLVAGLVTAVVLVRRPFPQVEGSVRVPGLTGEVEVMRDEPASRRSTPTRRRT